MRLTWARTRWRVRRAVRPASSSSLTPSIIAHSNNAATGLGPVGGACLHQRRYRVAPVDRHELVTQLLGRRMQRHRESDREGRRGQPPDARDDPDRRHRHAARPEPKSPWMRSMAGHRLSKLASGSPIPMNTMFGQPAGPGRPRRDRDLLEDLARCEVTSEPGLAGGAEAARHGAAGLARDAHRGPVGIVHQHRLDDRTVVEAERPLGRLVGIRRPFGHGLERGGVRHRAWSRRADGRSVISDGRRTRR